MKRLRRYIQISLPGFHVVGEFFLVGWGRWDAFDREIGFLLESCFVSKKYSIFVRACPRVEKVAYVVALMCLIHTGLFVDSRAWEGMIYLLL